MKTNGSRKSKAGLRKSKTIVCGSFAEVDFLVHAGARKSKPAPESILVCLAEDPRKIKKHICFPAASICSPFALPLNCRIKKCMGGLKYNACASMGCMQNMRVYAHVCLSVCIPRTIDAFQSSNLHLQMKTDGICNSTRHPCMVHSLYKLHSIRQRATMAMARPLSHVPTIL